MIIGAIVTYFSAINTNFGAINANFGAILPHSGAITLKSITTFSFKKIFSSFLIKKRYLFPLLR